MGNRTNDAIKFEFMRAVGNQAYLGQTQYHDMILYSANSA